MKIAVAQIENNPAFHFGKANDFKIVTIEKDQIITIEEIHDTTHVHQARPRFLKDLGCSALICNGVGSGAMERLEALDIEVYGFNHLTVEAAIQSYLRHELPQATDVFDCAC